MNRTTIRLPDRLLEAVENRAVSEGRSTSNIIRHILNLEFGFPDTVKLPLKKNPKLALK